MYGENRQKTWKVLIEKNDYVICRPISYVESIEFEEGDYPVIHMPGEEINGFECHEFWQRALASLSNASDITFIGYSMPQYDISEQCLFRFSYSKAKQMNSLDQNICIINPDPNIFNSYEKIYKREKITNEQSTFDSWVQKNRVPQ